jgi:hypothetical protein
MISHVHGRALHIAIVVAVLVAVLVPAPVRAVHDTGVFELDGNSAVDAPPADDFDTISAGPGGSIDHVFADDRALPDLTIHEGGDKDFQPVDDWGCVSKSNPSGKLDLRFAYAAAYVIGGDVHVFFGLNRESSIGTASVGFWFFQEQVFCDAAGTAGVFMGRKTDGDLLVVSEFTGGGTIQTVNLYRWTDPTPVLPESGDESLQLVVGGADCAAADPHAASPLVCGTQNEVPITPAWEAGPLAPSEYFEGGLNLTKLFAEYFAKDVCYISFQAKSRASTALDADLEDIVQGELQTCGSIAVTKATDPPGDPQSFPLEVSGGPEPISDAFTLGDGGSNETTSVRPGTYRITETVPAGWAVSATCSGGPFGTGAPYTSDADFPLGPGESVACAFLNTKLGRITVDKASVPGGDPTLFGFTTAGGPTGVNDTFQLADATAPHTTADLLPGDYTVTELVPAGWTLTAACVGGPFGAGAAYTSGAPMTLAAGDEVHCTFTDVSLAAVGALTVDKVTVPAGSPASFDFVIDGPGGFLDTFALTDAALPHTASSLAPGAYRITEGVPPGWTASATCTGGSFGAGGAYTPGDPIPIVGGDHVACTFQDVFGAAGVGTITVAKVTVPAANPTLFTFTTAGGPDAVSDVFQLAGGMPPHATPNLAPGVYRLTETKPAGWDLAITCAGGPFGVGATYANGAPFTVAAGDQIACTATNTLRQVPAGRFCANVSTSKILSPTTGRFPGNLGMDLVVRTDLGESIQDAIDHAADHNGDGQIMVGVYGTPSLKPGGHTSEQIVIDQAYPAPFRLVGCSVTLHDPAPADGRPTIHVTATASPDIFVMGLYAEDSETAGWLVEGDGRSLYSVDARRNATGALVLGDGNRVELGHFRYNAGHGLSVLGDGNRVIGAEALENGGHGFRVVGDDNQVVRVVAGDRRVGNGGDGIHVIGAGLLLERNTVMANGGDGIEVSGGTAANPNVLLRNLIGGYDEGNGGLGILMHNDTGNGGANPVEIDANTVRNNGEGGIFLAVTAIGHEFRRNFVGGTSIQDNQGCEFDVAEGNLNATKNTANRKVIAGRDGTPFPTGCLGSP